jgi:hypothetical protein
MVGADSHFQNVATLPVCHWTGYRNLSPAELSYLRRLAAELAGLPLKAQTWFIQEIFGI